MTPHVYTYQDPVKQTTFYRGYVKTYHGNIMQAVNCQEVRKNKLMALEDAKKLLKKLRKQHV